MPDIAATVCGHLLMLYAAISLGAVWAWGGRRGVPESLLTVFGLALPVGAWTFSIVKPEALWLAPASFVALYALAVRSHHRLLDTMRAHRSAERAAAEDRALAAPDDGAARMTLAKIAEQEKRFDDALDHYEAAHRLSDRMFTAEDLASARDHLEVLRAVAAHPKGLSAHPLDAALMAASAALAFSAPVRGIAPLTALAFVCWMRGDFGGD